MMNLTNLQTRILVSSIYFPVLLWSTFDLRAFALLMSLCVGLSWHEYLSFQSKPNSQPDWVRHLLFIFLGTSPCIFVTFGSRVEVAFAFLVFVLQMAIIYSLIQKKSLNQIKERLSFYLLGFFYITLLFSLLLTIHSFVGGREAIWFLLFTVAVTDTGAYFAGKKLGKTPFFQHISPSKTLEGVWGGLAAAFAISILFYFVFKYLDYLLPNLIHCILLGLSISFTSIFGDLFESLLKRTYGVKDSGRSLPGHGGILDRFDGVLFAGVPLFFFVILRGGFR